jgi:hypothetical protein
MSFPRPCISCLPENFEAKLPQNLYNSFVLTVNIKVLVDGREKQLKPMERAENSYLLSEINDLRINFKQNFS